MSTKASVIFSFALIALAVAVGIVLYPHLPDPMPSHWDAAGQVNGYMSKLWGVFLLPLMTAGLTLLLVAVPSIDPLRANIEQFRRLYNVFIVGFVAFMLYVYGLILAAGLGHSFDMGRALLPALGLLFVGVGRMVGRAKRNYFIGIRTPWTLADSDVWDATHRLGGWTFTAAGIVVIIAGVLGANASWVVLGTLAMAALIPVVYSYLLWRRRHP